MNPKEIIQGALAMSLIDEDENAVEVKLLPPLTALEIDQFVATLPCPLPDGIRELLGFCSGIEGLIEQIDFTGKARIFEATDLLPYGVPIAHDGYGNFWVVDLVPGASCFGPIFFCCHDAPILLYQSPDLSHFLSEVIKMHLPERGSLVDAVHEDQPFDVWRKNPGVRSFDEARTSGDPVISQFAGELDANWQLVDLRDVPIGMGFSWGRYGPKTEIRRYGYERVFAYRKPERTGFLARLFGR